MAVEELFLYLLIAPGAAYAVAVVWVRLRMRSIAAKELGFLREPGITVRFLVYTAQFAVSLILGLSLFVLLLDVPQDPVTTEAARGLGMAFAASAALTTLSQAWIIVRRREAAFRGASFVRVLVLATLPEVVVVFALTTGFLVAGILVRGPSEPPLSMEEFAAVTRATRFEIIGALSAPLVASLSNQVKSLVPGRFPRALVLGLIGVIPVFVFHALAIAALAMV